MDQIVTRVVAGSQLQQCAFILARAVFFYIIIRYIVLIYRYMHTKKNAPPMIGGAKNEILVFLQNIGKIIDMAVKKGV